MLEELIWKIKILNEGERYTVNCTHPLELGSGQVCAIRRRGLGLLLEVQAPTRQPHFNTDVGVCHPREAERTGLHLHVLAGSGSQTHGWSGPWSPSDPHCRMRMPVNK